MKLFKKRLRYLSILVFAGIILPLGIKDKRLYAIEPVDTSHYADQDTVIDPLPGTLQSFSTMYTFTSDYPEIPLSVIPLDLSKPPSTEQIMAAGQFGGLLYPTYEVTEEKREQEFNLSFGVSMQAWNEHQYQEAIELFKEHIEKYPDSPWVSEAVLHMGCDSEYNGRYTEAEKDFSWVIEANKDKDYKGAQALLNKARLRLGVLKVYQFNYDEAKDLFRILKKESPDWRDRTYASHWIQRLSRYKADEEALLNCGTRALAYILEMDCRETEAQEILQISPQISLGHSLKDLSDIAVQFGYKTTALKLDAAELKNLPLPAIMHIQGSNGDGGHYWILERVAGNIVDLFDPQSTSRYQQNLKEFAHEWSGNAIVFSNKDALADKRLAENDSEQIFGGCCGVPRPPDHLGCPGRNAGPKTCECGPVQWSVNMINMNLYLQTTPLWYRNYIGPSVGISLSYNSLSSTTYHEPFGHKWQFNYGTYLVVHSGDDVTIYMPDGRIDVYTENGSNGYNHPPKVYNTLTKIRNDYYKLQFPDGTLFYYKEPQGTQSQQLFLVEKQDPYGNSLTFIYEEVNNIVRLKTIKDEMERVTTLTYNNDAQSLVATITDPFNRQASFEYINGTLNKITDMGNNWTEFTYDADVYLTSIKNEKGLWLFDIEESDEAQHEVEVFSYPPPGGFMWENYRITITNPSEEKEEYYYSGDWGQVGYYVSPKHYMTYRANEYNNFSNAFKTTFNFWRPANQEAEIEDIIYPDGSKVTFGYDNYGNRNSMIDANNNTTILTYTTYTSNKGRIKSIKDPLENLTQFSYLGESNKLTSIIDADLNTYTYEYNGNNLAKIKYPDYLNNGEVNLTYNNNYGAINFLTDQRENIYEFTYDTDGTLTSVKNPRWGSAHPDDYTYDEKGRVSTHTDPNSNTVIYGYDNLDRIKTVTYEDSSVKSYDYNCCGLTTVTVTKPNEQDRVLTFSYENGKLANYTDIYGKTIAYAFDKNGNLETLTYPDDKVVTYSYDERDRLVSVTDWLNKTVTYEYDGAGNLIKTVYPEGSAIRNQYDKAGRLISIADYKTSGSVNGLFNYTNDKLGNREQVSFYQLLYTIPLPQNVTNTYADDNALVSSNSSFTFEYDYNGNLLNKKQNGNVTSSYEWNHDNMLTQIVSGCNSINYVYDGLGNRVAKISGTEKRYVVNPIGTLLAETDSIGNITAYYVYGLGLISKITPSNEAYYYHYDGLGSTIAITDSNGSVVNKYAYDAFGKVLSQAEDIPNPFKYVGKYGVMDDGTGLLYMRARYYDPEMRRFINKDPIGFGGGLNMFSYVGNNPVNWVDPEGLQQAIPWLIPGWIYFPVAFPAVASAIPIILGSCIVLWPSEIADEPCEDNYQHCLRLYELCDSQQWKGDCSMCFRYCLRQREWDFLNCPPGSSRW
jgi:RHS repeat-associated protein